MHASLFWSCLCGYNKVLNAVNTVIYKEKEAYLAHDYTGLKVQINMVLVFWPQSPGMSQGESRESLKDNNHVQRQHVIGNE